MTTSLAEITLGDGLRSPAQGLGAMALTGVYGTADASESLATINHAIDIGVTHIDTANIYGQGENERLIAQVLKTRRDEVVLASKCGIPFGTTTDGIRARGDAAYVRESIHESLGRLGTDVIDLYYYHRVDPRVAIEETVGALAELVTAGDIRHIGLSEVTAGELRRAHAVHPIATVQSEWSLWSRDVEAEIVPTAAELGVGFVPYSPLGRGFFTGAGSATLGEGDMRARLPRFAPELAQANNALAAELADLAAGIDITPAQAALAWLYAKGREYGISLVPIPGTRRASRVEENAAAAGIVLEAEAVRRLDSIAERVQGERSYDLLWISQGRELAQRQA